jgi:hypothetical protein
MLSFGQWKGLLEKNLALMTESQVSYYSRKGTCPEILELVALDSKRFGSVAENIIQEIFGLEARTSSQHDGIRNGKKLEIKSSRYLQCSDDCMWQHFEPNHDYDAALCVLLDFDGWKVWGIDKRDLMGHLRDKKLVTYQGQQGWWTKKSKIKDYLTPITSVDDLDNFLKTNETQECVNIVAHSFLVPREYSDIEIFKKALFELDKPDTDINTWWRSDPYKKSNDNLLEKLETIIKNLISTKERPNEPQ